LTWAYNKVYNAYERGDVMNAILGGRIRYLRESKGLTQEQVAEKMNCTRQKYARIEKGLIDISYSNITIIADILEIEPEEITYVVNNIKEDKPMFRKNDGVDSEDKFEYINEMINIFYAHRALYNSIRQVEVNE
jgi:transcriptional regulator with XRE-family HTH domain